MSLFRWLLFLVLLLPIGLLGSAFVANVHWGGVVAFVRSISLLYSMSHQTNKQLDNFDRNGQLRRILCNYRLHGRRLRRILGLGTYPRILLPIMQSPPSRFV